MANGADELLWYFAYGSNMQRATFYERRGMKPLEWRLARLDNHRLVFNLPVGPGERGVANVAPSTGSSVHGVAFLITAAQFDSLDRTEGVSFGAYARIPVSLSTADDDALAGYTYRSQHSAVGRKPSRRYIELILEGAREHALPEEYLRFLNSFALATDEREG